MKNRNSSRYRSLLTRGARALAMTSVLLAIMASCGHDRTDTDNSSSKSVATTTCTTSTTTSTSTTSTTSSTTTGASTTTTVVTTTEPVTEKIAEENIVQTEPVYVEPVTEYVESTCSSSDYSEDDVILLAKLINHEASTTYDGKLMVGSCVVNRMNIKGMSVSGVIYERDQFTTAYDLTTYTDLDYQVAQQVLSQGSADVRIYYFDGCHSDRKNWFYTINHEYLGAW